MSCAQEAWNSSRLGAVMEGSISRSRMASRRLKEMIAEVGEALLGVLEAFAAVAKAHPYRAICGVLP